MTWPKYFHQIQTTLRCNYNLLDLVSLVKVTGQSYKRVFLNGNMYCQLRMSKVVTYRLWLVCVLAVVFHLGRYNVYSKKSIILRLWPQLIEIMCNGQVIFVELLKTKPYAISQILFDRQNFIFGTKLHHQEGSS